MDTAETLSYLMDQVPSIEAMSADLHHVLQNTTGAVDPAYPRDLVFPQHSHQYAHHYSAGRTTEPDTYFLRHIIDTPDSVGFRLDPAQVEVTFGGIAHVIGHDPDGRGNIWVDPRPLMPWELTAYIGLVAGARIIQPDEVATGGRIYKRNGIRLHYHDGLVAARKIIKDFMN